jgi:outer membrane lipase/esterase
MLRKRVAFAVAVAISTGPASAQNFNQAIVFGDSSVDSGAYRGLTSPGGGALYNSLWPTAVANGAGRPTNSPALMGSEQLAAFFGLSATPASQPGIPGQPGGTNYATSGARSDLINGPASGLFNAAVPMTTQINNYLASVGGRANPNALYVVGGGGNDVGFATDQSRSTAQFPIFPLNSAAANNYLVTQAQTLAGSVAQLQAAGARYIVVPNLPYSFPMGGGAGNAADRADRFLYSQTLWSSLAAAGVNFIPADFNSVRVAIAANPSAFGFQFVDTVSGHTACTQPAGVTGAWALLCSSNPGAPSTLAAPNADQTRLFADDQHLSAAGQRIQADYYYSLIVAPSQVSFLAENAVKTRSRSTLSIQNQTDVSMQSVRGPTGFNAWVTGDVSHLGMDNYQGFPDADSATPVSVLAGLDYRVGSLVVGGVVSTTTQRSSFGTFGNFTQDEFAASLYAAFAVGPLWGDAVGTYGRLDYAVNRTVPIGITLQLNNGNTHGNNWSVATEGGYKFVAGPLTHGPVAGIALQRVDVEDFVEVGSFTSLAFGSQARDSAISSLGYRASLELGPFRPFAQVVWNHELADTERDVRAWLTTVVAPGYSMPAVELGKDWGTAALGSTLKLGNGFTAMGAVTAEFGQNDARSYGGQIGLNIAF